MHLTTTENESEAFKLETGFSLYIALRWIESCYICYCSPACVVSTQRLWGQKKKKAKNSVTSLKQSQLNTPFGFYTSLFAFDIREIVFKEKTGLLSNVTALFVQQKCWIAVKKKNNNPLQISFLKLKCFVDLVDMSCLWNVDTLKASLCEITYCSHCAQMRTV